MSKILDGFYVADSHIHGKGVFTKRAFKRGEVIFIFKGKLIKRVNKTKKDVFANPMAIGVDKNTWVDPKGFFQYINHSCDPNMGVKGKVTFVALKNIKPGDELTFDYSINEADINWSMKCGCGSRLCRKAIKSTQFLPKKTYRKYLPYIPRYFQKVYNKYNG